MKKTFGLVLCIVLFALPGFGSIDPNPRSSVNMFFVDNTFTSKEGRFSIALPSGFELFKFEKVVKDTDSGKLELNQFSTDSGRGTCMLAYYDLPDSLFQTKTIQKLLEDGRDGTVKNATLVKQESISVEGFSGLSLYVQIKSGDQVIYARSDFLVAKPRMYNILYLSLDEAELYKADVKSYFKSFHFLSS